MARCLLITSGSHGDIRPYAALGRELQERGHTVTLMTSENGAPFCREEGFTWRLLSGNFTDLPAIREGIQLELSGQISRRKQFGFLREVSELLVGARAVSL